MSKRKLDGFSLMEMMIVLLITAIIAAAGAPLVTKKMMSDTAAGNSPWIYTGHSQSIAYNLGGKTSTAIIGATKVPNGTTPKLYIESSGNEAQIGFGKKGSNDVISLTMDTENKRVGFSNITIPNGSVAIGCGQDLLAGKYQMYKGTPRVIVGSNAKAANGSIAIGPNVEARAESSIAIGTNMHGADSNLYNTMPTYTETVNSTLGGVAIGMGVHTDGGVAIGRGSETRNGVAAGQACTASGAGSVAIGEGAYAQGQSAIAIGGVVHNFWDQDRSSLNIYGFHGPEAQAQASIAIGQYAYATSRNSIALGRWAYAKHENSTAIGNEATTTSENQIVLGTSSDTVYIPGNLVVGKRTVLGRDLSDVSSVWLRANPLSGSIKRGWVSDETNRGLIFSNTAQNMSTNMPSWVSDRRLKNVGEKFTAGINELSKLDFFHYTFKKDEAKTPHVGVIAQDLQKVFPDAVTKNDDGFLHIRWEDMFYAAINAIKELNTKITEIADNLTNTNSRLEEQTKIIAKQAVLNQTQQETIANQQKTIEVQQKTINNLIERIEKLEKKI